MMLSSLCALIVAVDFKLSKHKHSDSSRMMVCVKQKCTECSKLTYRCVYSLLSWPNISMVTAAKHVICSCVCVCVCVVCVCVTADFGLAKQKRSDCSKMMSIVGTILYSW